MATGHPRDPGGAVTIRTLDIDAWAAEVAAAEAVQTRAAVREALLAGGGIPAALDAVCRRLARLTLEQREAVVTGIGVPARR